MPARRPLSRRFLPARLPPCAPGAYLTQQITRARLLLTGVFLSAPCAICDPPPGLCWGGCPAQCAIEVLPSSLMRMSNVAYAPNVPLSPIYQPSCRADFPPSDQGSDSTISDRRWPLCQRWLHPRTSIRHAPLFSCIVRLSTNWDK